MLKRRRARWNVQCDSCAPTAALAFILERCNNRLHLPHLPHSVYANISRRWKSNCMIPVCSVNALLHLVSQMVWFTTKVNRNDLKNLYLTQPGSYFLCTLRSFVNCFRGWGHVTQQVHVTNYRNLPIILNCTPYSTYRIMTWIHLVVHT